ncbi:MAG: hypothetical protein M3340_14365 [Actinomycetota bacterium]|nr:hypothetical protein [Actinomycetota bacterium]
MPRTISGREASIFACFTDAVVAPEPALPPVRETDAIPFFDHWMSLLPRANRTGMRGLLLLAELAPLATHGRRLRRLDRDRRADWLRRAEHSRNGHVRNLMKLMESAAQLAYYGNDAVSLQLGYDAEANLRRGRELRAREGRP